MNYHTDISMHVVDAITEQEAHAQYTQWVDHVDAQVERRDEILESFDDGQDSIDVITDGCVLDESRIGWMYMGHDYASVIANKRVVYMSYDMDKVREMLSYLLDTWLSGGYFYHEMANEAKLHINTLAGI